MKKLFIAILSIPSLLFGQACVTYRCNGYIFSPDTVCVSIGEGHDNNIQASIYDNAHANIGDSLTIRYVYSGSTFSLTWIVSFWDSTSGCTVCPGTVQVPVVQASTCGSNNGYISNLNKVSFKIPYVANLNPTRPVMIVSFQAGGALPGKFIIDNYSTATGIHENSSMPLILKTEYYNMTGQKINSPIPGAITLKVDYYEGSYIARKKVVVQ